MEEPYREAAVAPTLTPNKKYCHACAAVLDVRAELCPRCGIRQLVALAPIEKVLVVGPEKSPGTAFALALLFGPLGMMYSTMQGALLIFIANLFLYSMVGLGFLLTVPIGAFWAAAAATEHNRKLREQLQPQLPPPPPGI